MTAPLRIVAHEATRTGAPVVLEGLLRFARARVGVPIDVRIRIPGPLTEALQAAGDGPSHDAPAAVMANSSLAADAVFEVPEGTPTAVYVHEEGDALRQLPPEKQRALTDRANLVLTVSDRSREDLLALGVPPERVQVLPPLVEPGPPPDEHAVRLARQALTPEADIAVVVGCGEVTWRKGADLFVAVLGELRHRHPVAAAWIGRRFAAEAPLLDHDARLLGIQGDLRWIGEVADPAAYLAAADVVVMTSREDPRPMVPMESALVGTPTVGFAVGGLVDLAANSAAAVVPYPDVAGLAAVVDELLDDADRRRSIVERCAAVIDEHQRLEVVGPQFVAHLRSLLGARPGPHDTKD